LATLFVHRFGSSPVRGVRCEEESTPKNPRGKRRAIRDWNDIQFVLAVAQTGSYQAAGHHLGTHQTTVARRVLHLERELATKLFDRRSRGMVLTPAGEALTASAAAMEDAAKTVRSEIAGLDASLTGTIRVTVPEGIGAYWVMPVLPAFQVRYPDIAVEVLTEPRGFDMSAREIDVAISLSRPTQPRLIATRVGIVHYNLFASRKYLRQHGVPRTVEELRAHKLVDIHLFKTEPHLSWWNDLTARLTRNVAFVSNSSILYLTAIQEGLGIGMAPTFCKFAIADLMTVPVPPECHADLWLVWHEAARRNARIQAFTEFLKHQFLHDQGRWFS
jgi:DNA-binding transcriptional LysR family regulator